MKKVITILIIICIMLCGCDKSGSAPASTPTPEPATPTQEPTQIPTEKPATNNSGSERVCDRCGATPVKYAWNVGDNHYFLCEDCNIIAIKEETDWTQYNTLAEMCSLACTELDVLDDLANLGNCTVKIGPDGVTLENAGNSIKEYFKKSFPDYETWTTAKDYEVEIGQMDKGIGVTKKVQPDLPLAYIEK